MKSQDFNQGFNTIGFAKQTPILSLSQNFSSLINRAMQKSFFTKIWSWIIIALTVVSLNYVDAQTVTLTVDKLTCASPASNGSMVATITGGTPPYNITNVIWRKGSSTTNVITPSSVVISGNTITAYGLTASGTNNSANRYSVSLTVNSTNLSTPLGGTGTTGTPANVGFLGVGATASDCPEGC